eukprot:Opistho-2@43906
MASRPTATFSSLPIEVILCHVVPFLSNKDLASFAGVNSRLRWVLKQVHVYSLNHESSAQYWWSAAFRNAVWADIPRERLKLDLFRVQIVDGDLSVLGGVHSLDLSNCYGVLNVSTLGGVHSLTLSGCNRVTDVSALVGV